MGPLDRQTRRHLPHRRFGRIVRRLGLGHVDDGPRHGADHDDAAGRFALHEVAGHADGEEVGAVHVDAPELLHAVVGVGDGVEVLGEAGGGDEVVDAAVGREDFGDGGCHGVGVRDVGVVGGDFGAPVRGLGQLGKGGELYAWTVVPTFRPRGFPGRSVSLILWLVARLLLLRSAIS